jgi:hypothetical protein
MSLKSGIFPLLASGHLPSVLSLKNRRSGAVMSRTVIAMKTFFIGLSEKMTPGIKT